MALRSRAASEWDKPSSAEESSLTVIQRVKFSLLFSTFGRDLSPVAKSFCTSWRTHVKENVRLTFFYTR